MEIVKKTDDYIVVKKRSGRFGVKNSRGKWINQADKVKILVDEGLIKAAIPKKEEAVSEAPAQEEKSE